MKQINLSKYNGDTLRATLMEIKMTRNECDVKLMLGVPSALHCTQQQIKYLDWHEKSIGIVPASRKYGLQTHPGSRKPFYRRMRSNHK